MGHQNDLPAHMLGCQGVGGGGDALAQRDQRFAALGRKGGVALAPAVGLFRLFGFQLFKGMALQHAKAALTQALVRCQGRLGGFCDGAGRDPGALQVAAVDGVDGLIGQRQGGLAGLPQAHVVQRNVQMALEAAVHVPGGFSVADGDDAGGVHAMSGLGR